MRKTAVALLTFLLVALQGVQANLYLPESELNQIQQPYASIIPHNVNVLFVLESDKQRFVRHLDGTAFEGRPALQKLVREAFLAPRSDSADGSLIYASMERSGKGLEDEQLCVIFTVDSRLIKVSLMHELMHCLQFSNKERFDIARQIKPILDDGFTGAKGEVVSRIGKSHTLIEVHARILAHVFHQQLGIEGDDKSLQSLRLEGYPYNPGKSSIEYGLQLCQAIKCSTDPSDLMGKLVSESGFLDAFRKDLSVVHQYEIETGHFRPRKLDTPSN